jgi:hypothetical protein
LQKYLIAHELVVKKDQFYIREFLDWKKTKASETNVEREIHERGTFQQITASGSPWQAGAGTQGGSGLVPGSFIQIVPSL